MNAILKDEGLRWNVEKNSFDLMIRNSVELDLKLTAVKHPNILTDLYPTDLSTVPEICVHTVPPPVGETSLNLSLKSIDAIFAPKMLTSI